MEGNAAEGTGWFGEGTTKKYSWQNPAQSVVAWKQLKHTVWHVESIDSLEL